MKFYDAHIHFFYECPLDELRRIFRLLETMGVGGIDVLVIAEYPAEMETVLKMIPGEYHPYSTPGVFENQRDPFPALSWPGPVKIVPFLDGRFIENQIEQKIKMFRQRGFKGLKLLYVPEEDPELRVGGMEKTFGRSCKRSEEITASLIESASAQDMSVMMHVDLRKYGKFVEKMIHRHSQTNFNIPHFGFSRRAISLLLERYPNCYTDLSHLRPFIEKDPVSYRDFIRRYQDRILFGSDALIIQPEHVQSTLKFIDRFLDDMEIFHKLVNKNYSAFHGIPDDV